jgi:hypothetical protein
MNIQRHPETGLPIEQPKFQFGFSSAMAATQQTHQSPQTPVFSFGSTVVSAPASLPQLPQEQPQPQPQSQQQTEQQQYPRRWECMSSTASNISFQNAMTNYKESKNKKEVISELFSELQEIRNQIELLTKTTDKIYTTIVKLIE